MKVLQINGGVFGSTGNIMFGIAREAKIVGIETFCAAPITSTNRYREPSYPYIKIGTYNSRRFNVLLSRISGGSDCFSNGATFKLLRKISKLAPDIIHLHNLHNSYLNLPMLFKYIRKHNIRVVWTLHDCWAFTGHCPHFDMIGCDKWENGCYKCPQYKEYPKSYVDNSKLMYRLKKKWFTGINNLTIVTPSKWLSGLVKQSFLKDYPIKVINNGIDLSIFKPTESDFRKKYHCEDKFILLGVAFGWGKRKGLDVFIELSKRLDERFQIVLVGTDENVDKQLPNNIISIHRTQNQVELAEIYTVADLFVNPTQEENFPTVNIESLACGTPILTFQTGGSPEILDETCGSVVEKGNVEGLYMEINRIYAQRPFTRKHCLARATKFDMDDKFTEYIKLYFEIKSDKDEVY